MTITRPDRAPDFVKYFIHKDGTDVPDVSHWWPEMVVEVYRSFGYVYAGVYRAYANEASIPKSKPESETTYLVVSDADSDVYDSYHAYIANLCVLEE